MRFVWIWNGPKTVEEAGLLLPFEERRGVF
jgi:hypothetical protein